MRLLFGMLFALLLEVATARPAAQTTPKRALHSGRVLAATQQPLAGVSVQLLGSALGASTNGDGQFLLEQLPAGTHTLQFAVPGYQLTDVIVSDTTRWPLTVVLRATRPPARPRRH